MNPHVKSAWIIGLCTVVAGGIGALATHLAMTWGASDDIGSPITTVTATSIVTATVTQTAAVPTPSVAEDSVAPHTTDAAGATQWMSVPAYETTRDVSMYTGDDGRFFTMAGKRYTNGYTLDLYESGAHALFNLDGKYANLKLDVGRVDGTGAADAVLRVFLDGKPGPSFDLRAEDLVRTINIRLGYARQLKLQMSYIKYNGYPTYGLSNGAFS